MAKEITANEVVLEQGNEEIRIAADTVFLATGLRPDLRLYEELCALKVASRVELIGDPKQAMHAIESVTQAFNLALQV